MGTIRIAWGSATGPTPMAAYDAALAEANLHNYNLVPVSSVVPSDADIEAVGTAPDLGPAGNRLTVVQAKAVTAGPGRATAGLGWASGPGPGLFYEATGAEEAVVRERVMEGLAAGAELREWVLPETETEVVSGRTESGYVAAVVLAAYGESEPVFGGTKS
jgi:arginine decarboxylase